ncbi:hypothetical protein DFJ74DRAFT_679398 [Hyaloraphidium curvatum]|nr:hypothetical protein DFJ74DRAFT_679398 [Hyaloraphidium curvatum]
MAPAPAARAALAALIVAVLLAPAAAQDTPSSLGCPAVFPQPTNVSFSPAPVLSSATYDPTSENLTFVVTSGVYWDGSTTVLRSITLQLGTDPSAPPAECIVGPTTGDTFAGDVNGCTTTVTLTNSWAALRFCQGWSATPETGGLTNYSNTITVRYADTIITPSVNTVRNQEYTQPLQMSFPTTLNISAGVNVTDDTGVNTFVVTQLTYTYQSPTSRLLRMDYTITNSYPFLYTYNNVTVPEGSGLTLAGGVTPTYSPTGCEAGTGYTTTGQTCRQDATITWTIPDTTCSLAGRYRIGFNTACAPSNPCGANSYIVDVDVGEYTICGNALDQAITGVTGSLTPAQTVVAAGGAITMNLQVSSPNKNMNRVSIFNAWIASTKHAADQLWANRSLLQGSVPSTLGTVLSFAATPDFVQTDAVGRDTYTAAVSLNALTSSSNTDPNGGLLKPADLGTANNEFTLHLENRLFFDTQSFGRRRRRRRLLMLDAELEMPFEAARGFRDTVEVTVYAREVAGANPFAKDARVLSENRLQKRGPITIRINAEVQSGGVQDMQSGFTINASNAGGSSVPVGAIVGAVVGSVALVGVIAGVTVWGVRRKRTRDAAATASADSEKGAPGEKQPPVELAKTKTSSSDGASESTLTLVSADGIPDAVPVAAVAAAVPAKATDAETALAIAQMESALKSEKRRKKKKDDAGDVIAMYSKSRTVAAPAAGGAVAPAVSSPEAAQAVADQEEELEEVEQLQEFLDMYQAEREGKQKQRV